ncbi:putative orfan [Tupanvirus soda lake]|uniref:Orfan n=2 Tax=Tupanvirus TaxID=2094720 RepID=A0AC62ACN9_9VIRU|nr:putative orfan [Tupanvirus soda lake]QKU35557.1 putative orfan [Tupanvirus soda lake]
MESYYFRQTYSPLMCGAGGFPPNDPHNILERIHAYLKEKDAYFSSMSDPLINTNIKYIANVNLVAICMQNIIPPIIKYGTTLTSFGYVCLATFYQHKRINLYSYRNNDPKRKLFEYSCEIAIKNLVLYPYLTFIMCKPFSGLFLKPKVGIPLTLVVMPLVYIWDKPLTFASKLIVNKFSKIFPFEKK